MCNKKTTKEIEKKIIFKVFSIIDFQSHNVCFYGLHFRNSGALKHNEFWNARYSIVSCCILYAEKLVSHLTGIDGR